MKTWNPPESPLTISYPEELFRDLKADPARIEVRGILQGGRDGSVVQLRALDASRNPAENAIGVYFLRTRGPVFLSDANIDYFENNRALVALVIAGGSAGFFLRGYDGSLQTVRSFQEFTVLQPKGNPWLRVRSVALLWTAALPLLALAYIHRPAATGLSVREERNQVVISWKPGRAGLLQISEGVMRTTIPVLPNQSSANYVRRTDADVKVTLTRP